MGSGQLEVRLLGRFAVSRDGKELPLSAFGGRMSRRLFRYLVCSEGALIPRDVLVEALWGDEPPADPAANLKVLVNRARRVVDEAIVTGPGGYRVDPGACAVDGWRFLSAVAEAAALQREGSFTEAGDAFDAALALWTGEPMPEDLYEPWAETTRRRLLDGHLTALEGGATAALARGRPDRAVELATTACDREPLRDGPHLLLARALLAVGDRPRALEVLRALSQRTVSELGLDPSPAVRRLEAQLLAGRGGAPSGTRLPDPARAAATIGAASFPLVDRDADLARAQAALQATPHGSVVAVGPPGSGKSRFLFELAASAPAPVLVRAYRAERDRDGGLLGDLVRASAALTPGRLDALHPRVQGALATLAPELADDEPTTLDPPSLRSLLTEGAVAVLGAAARRGALLLVDDIQWADPSSLRILAAAIARVPALRIVLGLRSGETESGGALDELLLQLHAEPGAVCEIHLTPLTAEGLSSVADPPVVAVLSEQTDGSPFAVTQVVAALRAADLVEEQEGRLIARSDTTPDELLAAAREGYQRTLQTRVRRQPPARRELLQLICLLGRAASGRLLATASRRDIDAVVQDLEALTRSGLAHASSRGWTVPHQLTSSVIVAALDPVRRRRLHARLAGALQSLEAEPGEVAVHLEASDDPAEAATAHARAAAERLARAATDEAARHAEAGLRLAPSGHVRRDLLRLHAEAVAALGRLDEARADLQQALREAREGPERAGLLTRLALMSLGADHVRRAEELAEMALLEAGGDRVARARALAVAAVVDMNQGRSERSRERSDEALGLFRDMGDAGGVAGILDARAMARFLDGDVAGAVTAFHHVARGFEDAGQLLRVITPRSTRGHALAFADRAEEGLADVEAASHLAEALGHVEGQAYAAWHRSEILTALGRVDDAAAAAATALATASRIGHRGWTATAHLARGSAFAASGDDEAAVDAFRSALELSESLPLFQGWAAARLARLELRRGRLADAAPLVELATRRSPPLGAYETRLAEVELLLAQDDPSAGEQLRRAETLARSGGHVASARMLSSLAAAHGLGGEARAG